MRDAEFRIHLTTQLCLKESAGVIGEDGSPRNTPGLTKRRKTPRTVAAFRPWRSWRARALWDLEHRKCRRRSALSQARSAVHLRSSIFDLRSSIFDLPSSIFHLPSLSDLPRK